MNYLGNKYKLLSQMLQIFPKDIDNFYDLFAGGLDVSLNVDAKTIIANDKHKDLIWLYKEVMNYSGNLGDELMKMDKEIFPMNWNGGKALNSILRGSYNNEKALRSYNNSKEREIWNKLMNEKREVFYKIREEFSISDNKDFKILLLIMLNSVGTIEFRVVNGYVTFTCGNNRVNPKSIKTLNKFPEKVRSVKLTNNDFRYYYEVAFNKDDFVYLDPPYIGTTQYKVRWTKEDEIELYSLLDYLNENKVKFALSNFADGENHTNEYLSKWCSKYNIHNLNDKHSNLSGIRKDNSKQRQEILITNY